MDRGKIRLDHRRDINVARVRLPPRPFPGTAGFTAVPPPTETRYVSTEMVFHVGPNVSRQTVDAQAKRLGLTVVGVQQSGITGGTLYHFGLPPGRQVADVVRSLETERLGIASPNYVYQIVQDTGVGDVERGGIAGAIHRREAQPRRSPQGRDRPRGAGRGDRTPRSTSTIPILPARSLRNTTRSASRSRRIRTAPA